MEFSHIDRQNPIEVSAEAIERLRDDAFFQFHDPILLFSSQGYLCEANHVAEQILGCSRRTILGVRFDFLPWWESQQGSKDCERALQLATRSQSAVFNTRIKSSTARKFTISAKVAPIYGANQSLAGFSFHGSLLRTEELPRGTVEKSLPECSLES